MVHTLVLVFLCIAGCINAVANVQGSISLDCILLTVLFSLNSRCWSNLRRLGQSHTRRSHFLSRFQWKIRVVRVWWCNDIIRRNVVPGTYVLQVHDNKNFYDPVLISVTRKESQEDAYNVNATLYNLRATEKTRKLKYPMQLSPSSRIQYFEVEPPFTIMSLVSSPMFMMIGFSVLMYFCVQNMPKPGRLLIFTH